MAEVPSSRSGRQSCCSISSVMFLTALRLVTVSIIAYGFRTSFREWAAEATMLPREVAEIAPTDSIGDKVEATKRRGNLLAEEPEIMEQRAGLLAVP